MTSRNATQAVADIASLRSKLVLQLRRSLAGGAEIWSDERTFGRALEAAVDSVVARVTRPGFARRQHARFGQGTDVEAFAPKWLSVSGNAHAVAELRFKGMDPNQPFVELSLTTWSSPKQLNALVREAIAGFGSFQPRLARLSLCPARRRTLKESGLLSVEADQHTLAAPLAALRSVAQRQDSKLALSPIDDVVVAYSSYSQLFDAFEVSDPKTASEVYRSRPEEFAEMVSHGKSFHAHVGGKWAGLVAATPGPLWGQSGWVMHEEFLAKEFRGRGLGLELQRALVARLDGDEVLLWGSIHATNEPSLRTALRNGRQIVQTHYFLGHDSAESK